MLLRLGQLLSNDPRLSKMLDKAHGLSKLSNLFANLLSSDLRNHCQLAKIENDELTVMVDGSIWASKLRYAIPDILKDLRTQPEFKSIKKIIYRVSASQSAVSLLEKTKTSKPEFSKENAALLKQLKEKLSKKCTNLK